MITTELIKDFEQITYPTEYDKYSEAPEKLHSLLKEVTISFKFNRIGKHFQDDKEERMIIDVKIERAGKGTILYEFGTSIYDTEIFNHGYKMNFSGGKFQGVFIDTYHQLSTAVNKAYSKFRRSMGYSVLCSIKTDFYCPTSNDSIKDRDTYIKCMDMKSKLERIFNADEIECLPS